MDPVQEAVQEGTEDLPEHLKPVATGLPILLRNGSDRYHSDTLNGTI